MKKNGFTLMETMFVVVISTAIFAVIFGLLAAGKNSWLEGSSAVELQQKARFAMDKIIKELRLADSSVTAIRDCGSSECNGQIITFRVPAASPEPRANTIYSDTGSIKWGAENVLYHEIQFFVTRDTGQLIRRVLLNVADGACCYSGACASLGQTTCTAIQDASFIGEGSSCSTPYVCTPAPPPPPMGFLDNPSILEETKTLAKNKVSELRACKSPENLIFREFFAAGYAYADDPTFTEKVIAANINSVSFVGFPSAFRPKAVEITLTAQNNSSGQRTLAATFKSRVTLRN